jgi:hypothetical protein
MNYVKVENGQVVQIGLPTTGILTQAGFEGCPTSDYDKLLYISDNPEIPSLKAEGWLPLTDNPPVFNPETEYLEHAGYSVGETEVVVNYTVKPIVITLPQPTQEEKLAILEQQIQDLSIALAEIKGMGV